jgi:hypothetical protein
MSDSRMELHKAHREGQENISIFFWPLRVQPLPSQ